MAMNAGIYPATLNCTCPDPAVDWQQSGFAILDKPAAWTSRPGRPRRVQVDAFGFGGSNFVVQLEQVEVAGTFGRVECFTAAPIGLPGVQLFQRRLAGNNYKLAIMADSPSAAERLLEQSGTLQNVAALTEKRRRSLSRQGVHISLPDPTPRRAALVFSGQGSQYVGMGKELYAELPEIRDLLAQAGDFFGFDIPALLFESGEAKLQATRWQQPAIFALEVAIARSLLSLGLKPVALAGHSLGQFAALCIAEVFSFADGCKIINQRALCMEQAGRLAADAGTMVAVHAGQDRVAPYLERTTGVFVLNSNSPLQTVIGGDTAATENLADELSRQGLRSTRLPVAMAFHSPLFRTVANEFAEFLQTIPFLPPTIPVLSNHTGAAFPSEVAEIRRLLAEHLYSPVDWLQNVRSLHTDYTVDLFVEAGPREALGNMIRDILPGADCLPTCLPSIELATLQNAVAQLFVNGCLPQPAAKSAETVLQGASASLPITRVIAPDHDCPVDEATLAGVMAVIVQTTGYEPEEVAADMDLRDDLAIRSSRLPVIADALETRFGITLDLQDFAGVRTVRDIAGRIAAIRQNCGPEAASRNRKTAQQAAIELAATADPAAASQPLRRITFAQELSPVAAPDYLQFSPLDKIGIICLEDDWREAAAAAAVFRRDHGAVLTRVESPEQAGDGLACLLLWIGDQSGVAATAVSRLTDCFLQIQAFCTQANARAVLLLQRAENRAAGRLVAAGLEGILLSLAWEYRSILFRSIRFTEGTLADSLIRRALDQNLQPLILFSRPEGVFVEIGEEAPLTATAGSSWQLGPADVVVISGGGAGILQEWVRALIPFGCRLVLLGRSKLSSAAGQTRSTEIADLLAELAAIDITVRYLPCDVADADQCEQALATVQNEFGRISGLIHGAGILRDNYLPQITAEEFTAVVNVKLQGADNLFQAAQGRGLRWFAAVSSVAAVNGNAGQAAYAAANRAMTAYLDLLQRQYPQIRCQALLLGPVEGGGMADTEELRALMRWSGYSYIHAREAAELFCREMARRDQAAGPVLFVRETPLVATAPVLRRAADEPDDNVENRSVNATMPLLDAVTFDWRNRSLVATRSVQAARDLWLPEHRPLPMLKQPIVSGVMMVEMFAEAARALYPYLSLQGLRQVKFIDRIECPLAQPRLSRIDCHVAALWAGGVDCALKLRTQELSPTGRQLDRWPLNAEAIVILGAAGRQNTAPIEGLPFVVDGIPRKTVNRPTLLKMYKRFTALTGRYQLLHKISSGGKGLVEAEFVLPQQVDFADRRANDYQTSPYLLEAMFQTVVFQTLLEQAAEVTTIALPYAVGELEYHQASPVKGRFRLQARRRGEDAVGVIWDAAVYDATGQPIQSARGLEMRWLSL
jgi:acyl transferase domain-containing protein